MSFKKPNILVVDDEPGHIIMLEGLLGKWNYQVFSAANGLEALEAVKKQPYDVVLMDIRMEEMDGLTALKEIKAYNPSVPIVIMTAHSAVESAVEALRTGAHDYLTKPIDFDALKITIEKAIEHRSLVLENQALKTLVLDNPDGILGNSPPMHKMRELIKTVAPSDATVLITGKSGTGKELVARALHSQSPRKNGPLVVVNCAALNENLLESELFGHEKGAFTGADKRRDGRFLQADKGTIFLDEIGEISPQLQVKLLRAIQQREIQRVGSDHTFKIDVRIVTATNRDLMAEVKAGRFREDLYYRLNVITINVPGLSEHSEDVPLLAHHFLNVFTLSNKKEIKGFTPQAMDLLIHYPWPGNIRELENSIEQAVVLSQGSYVTDKALPAVISAFSENLTGQSVSGEAAAPKEDGYGHSNSGGFLGGTLESLEREAVLQALKAAGGNKSEAAARLGISRKTLYTKLKIYGFG